MTEPFYPELYLGHAQAERCAANRAASERAAVLHRALASRYLRLAGLLTGETHEPTSPAFAWKAASTNGA